MYVYTHIHAKLFMKKVTCTTVQECYGVAEYFSALLYRLHEKFS